MIGGDEPVEEVEEEEEDKEVNWSRIGLGEISVVDLMDLRVVNGKRWEGKAGKVLAVTSH